MIMTKCTYRKVMEKLHSSLYIDFALALLNILSIAGHIYYKLRFREEVIFAKDTTIKFHTWARFYHFLMLMDAFTALIVLIKFSYMLRLFRSVNWVFKVLERMTKSLAVLQALFLTVFVAFSFALFLNFGYDVREASTLAMSFDTLIRYFFGIFDTQEY